MAVCDSGYDSISTSSAKSFWEGNASEALPRSSRFACRAFVGLNLGRGSVRLALAYSFILADPVKVSDTANR